MTLRDYAIVTALSTEPRIEITLRGRGQDSFLAVHAFFARYGHVRHVRAVDMPDCLRMHFQRVMPEAAFAVKRFVITALETHECMPLEWRITMREVQDNLCPQC